jgi:hypothetical protein
MRCRNPRIWANVPDETVAGQRADVNRGHTQMIISRMIAWVGNANDCSTGTYDRLLTQAIIRAQ